MDTSSIAFIEREITFVVPKFDFRTHGSLNVAFQEWINNIACALCFRMSFYATILSVHSTSLDWNLTPHTHNISCISCMNISVCDRESFFWPSADWKRGICSYKHAEILDLCLNLQILKRDGLVTWESGYFKGRLAPPWYICIHI